MLSNPSNATISDGTGLGTISDNDATPGLTVNLAAGNESAPIAVVVNLSAASGLPVSFTYFTSDGTAVS